MQNNKPFPTFKDSPAFKWFPHWQSDDGLIGAVDAGIYHNHDRDEFGGMVIKEVAVSFFPLRKMQQLKYHDHPLQREQQAIYGGMYGYTSHSGNDFDDWMKDGNVMPPAKFLSSEGVCLGYSPDGDFAFFKYFGFENVEYARQAMEQFAFIRECEWARDGSITPEMLVKPLSVRKREGKTNTLKQQIRSEEIGRCAEEFEYEINRRLSSGEMWCPKNVDICFNWPASVCGHVAETNPGSLEFREQWYELREKMKRECEVRIKQRENEAFS